MRAAEQRQIAKQQEAELEAMLRERLKEWEVLTPEERKERVLRDIVEMFGPDCPRCNG